MFTSAGMASAVTCGVGGGVAGGEFCGVFVGEAESKCKEHRLEIERLYTLSSYMGEHVWDRDKFRMRILQYRGQALYRTAIGRRTIPKIQNK